jgi:hypothetical protein
VAPHEDADAVAAAGGERVDLLRVPERLWNSAVSDNPHIAHTETWYFKS